MEKTVHHLPDYQRPTGRCNHCGKTLYSQFTYCDDCFKAGYYPKKNWKANRKTNKPNTLEVWVKDNDADDPTKATFLYREIKKNIWKRFNVKTKQMVYLFHTPHNITITYIDKSWFTNKFGTTN